MGRSPRRIMRSTVASEWCISKLSGDFVARMEDVLDLYHEYYDRDRMAFYRALQSVRRTNMDMTGWIEFFAIGLATQLAEVKRRGELAIQQDILARRHDLTDRQVLALRHVPQATILNAGHDSGSMPWCFR